MMIEPDKNKKSLSLYLHIPFCVKKCAYCDFLSGTASVQEQHSYVDALIEEIKDNAYLTENYQVKSVFIGGGTPSILQEVDMERLITALWSSFSIREEKASEDTENKRGIEITIEANPGTLTQKKLVLYRNLGINRLSLGLQSANQDELKLLGRIHTWQDFVSNYHAARGAGFTNINVDLMSALPLQTEEKWKTTLKKVMVLEPEHISAYSLMVEPGTKFYQHYSQNGSKESDLPDEETDRAIYAFTRRQLERDGYHRYEISNYAKPDYECVHNKVYWTGGEYLGLGLGSSSLMNHQRWKNESDMHRYLGSSNDSDQRCCEIEDQTEAQQMEEFVFLGLRLMRGISMVEFEETFQVPFQTMYGKVTEQLKRKKLLEQTGEMLRLTEKGIDLSNYVFVEFLLPH